MRLALVLMALILGAACDKAPGPEETLQRFLADLRFGRAEQAWPVLSQSSREALKTRHRQTREAAGLPQKEATPGELLYAQLKISVVSPPDSMAVASPLGDMVKLRISVKDGDSADIWMVREAGKWRVDLERSLNPVGPSSPAPLP